MLDPVAPECFHALFPRAVKALEAGGGLTAFRRLGDHVLPLHQAALCVLLDAQAQRRHDQIFPCASGRDAISSALDLEAALIADGA
jgi:hypothetical protein